jgi:hypothetical protein
VVAQDHAHGIFRSAIGPPASATVSCRLAAPESVSPVRTTSWGFSTSRIWADQGQRLAVLLAAFVEVQIGELDDLESARRINFS